MQKLKIRAPKSPLQIVYDSFTSLLTEDISIKTKRKKIAYIRWVFWRVIKDLKIKCTLEEMGAIVGKDHSSVYHGLIKYDLVIPQMPEMLDLHEKGLKLCREVLSRPSSLNLVTTDEIEMFDALWIAKDKEIKNLEKKLEAFNSNETLKEITSLSPAQFEMFAERVDVILKSIKRIRTYDNTPRSAFNVLVSA